MVWRSPRSSWRRSPQSLTERRELAMGLAAAVLLAGVLVGLALPARTGRE